MKRNWKLGLPKQKLLHVRINSMQRTEMQNRIKHT